MYFWTEGGDGKGRSKQGLLGVLAGCYCLAGIKWEFASWQFTELDIEALCTFPEVCYIHNERVLPKGNWRFNQTPYNPKFLFSWDRIFILNSLSRKPWCFLESLTSGHSLKNANENNSKAHLVPIKKPSAARLRFWMGEASHLGWDATARPELGGKSGTSP